MIANAYSGEIGIWLLQLRFGVGPVMFIPKMP